VMVERVGAVPVMSDISNFIKKLVVYQKVC